MPRKARQSKSEICTQLIPVFETYGYEGASLSMLAKEAGLSKASLYHHFPNGKADIAANVLAVAGARLQQLVISPLMSEADGNLRLRVSLENTAHYYSGDVPVCLMNSLLLGDGVALFGQQIGSAVAVWRQGLAKAYYESGAATDEANAWAEYAVERIQGALVLCRVNSSRKALEACLSELRADVALLMEQGS